MKKPDILSPEEIIMVLEELIASPTVVKNPERAIATRQRDQTYKDMLEQFIEWGYEDCPHSKARYLHAHKWSCSKCRQDLQSQLEEL